MKNRTILIAFSLLLSLTTFAQKQNNETEKNQSTNFSYNRTIEFKDHKKNEEIIVKIEKQTKRLELSIDTLVSSGKLTIEVYDSNKNKQGTFSVGTQLNLKNSENAHGKINKTLIEPQVGNWKIKIIPVNTTGMIQIHTTTFF